MDLQICGAEFCLYNRNGVCGKETLASINYKSSGEFRNGNRVVNAVCEDYKEIGEDDGAD